MKCASSRRGRRCASWRKRSASTKSAPASPGAGSARNRIRNSRASEDVAESDRAPVSPRGASSSKKDSSRGSSNNHGTRIVPANSSRDKGSRNRRAPSNSRDLGSRSNRALSNSSPRPESSRPHAGANAGGVVAGAVAQQRQRPGSRWSAVRTPRVLSNSVRPRTDRCSHRVNACNVPPAKRARRRPAERAPHQTNAAGSAAGAGAEAVEAVVAIAAAGRRPLRNRAEHSAKPSQRMQ